MSERENTAPTGPLWAPSFISELITHGAVHRVLSATARAELERIDNLPARVECALTDPKPLDISMPVLDAVLAAQYYTVFQSLALPKDVRVYEPCVGASCPVLLAAQAHGGQNASYLSINLNRPLREKLLDKIAHLSLSVTVIEDNARAAMRHVPPASMDVACFHHAINDILQTAVSEPRGMDTTAVDWFPNERQMIAWLAEDAAAGRLSDRAKPELMQIISDTVRLVRPGGHLVFDHFNWCRFTGVDWFPWDLFYNLIPMTRAWVTEAQLPLSEVSLPGVNPQWWMVLQVR